MCEVPINIVAKRTGLSQHVIRVWEKRYAAVTPQRTGGRQRLYNENDVARLALLARLTGAGHQISRIATLPIEQLEELWTRESREVSAPAGKSGKGENLIAEALRHVESMDRVSLIESLQRSAVTFGAHGSLEKVIAPLTERIGEHWRTGALNAAHEHFASATIREFLWGAARPFAPSANAPALVVTTPSGQLHELGAVIVSIAAADLGWRVIYLGPSLPPAEIAAAALQNKARAVALSIIYPEDDPSLPGEFETLRRYLPPEMLILAGGRAAGAYSQTLDKIGAIRPRTLQEMYDALDAIRLSKNGVK